MPTEGPDDPRNGRQASSLIEALAAIDRANSDDPNTELVDGEEVPKELHRGRLAHQWLMRLRPDASPAQQLAARAHHLRRWTRPRDAFPEGRAGYLRWRTEAKRRHGAEAAELLADAGVDAQTIERCRELIAKRGLGSDPEADDHEDAVCLVFFERDAASFAAEHGPDRTRSVLAATLAKMTSSGVRLLLAEAVVPADVHSLIGELAAPPNVDPED